MEYTLSQNSIRKTSENRIFPWYEKNQKNFLNHATKLGNESVFVGQTGKNSLLTIE